MKRIRSTIKAFTLVEIIVSLAIFSIVVMVALGALVKIIDANKKAQSLQLALTNLNFALESISREMRVGSTYYCSQGTSYGLNFLFNQNPCSEPIRGVTGSGGNLNQAILVFNSSKVDNSNPGNPCNLMYAYRFKIDPAGDHYSLEKAQQDHCEDYLTDDKFAPIVDPNVMITGFYLSVRGATYPIATLRISGYAGTRDRDRTDFDLQTAISARLP